MNSQRAKDGREAAVLILFSAPEKGEGLKEAERAVLASSDLSKKDTAFLTELVNGTYERLLTIDFCIGKFSKTPVKKIKPFLRADLRVAVFQLLFLTKVPESAAVNEAVKIAISHGFSGLKGFVNGLLRNIARNRETLLQEIAASADPAVRFSLPAFVFDSLSADYGKEKAAAIAEAFFQKKPLYALCLKNEDALLSSLRLAGYDAKDDPDVPYAFYIEGPAAGIAERVEFKVGAFYIMDRASMEDGLALAKILSELPQEDIRVLDLCAAPGGKSFHAASILEDRGNITARDVSAKKVARIKENIARCEMKNITAEVSDATVFQEADAGAYDVVIADVPCSGFGVIGNKPDIRYRHTAETMESLLVLQQKILENAVRYVKPGGYLIFSTCTLHREENEGNRKRIEDAGFTFVSEKTSFPDEGKGGGFYTALLKRE